MNAAKKTQTLKTVIIVVLIVACLVGAGAYGFFSNYNSGSTPQSTTSTSSDYTNAKNRVDTLTQELKSSPNDTGLQQDLGDAYYDLGTAARNNAPNETQEDYIQAVKYYQAVLKTKQDLNVLTDMATAAFYSEQFDLAEQSFQKALNINPNFTPALNNYGVFLYEVKKDNASAIRLWQTALNQDPNGPNSAQLKALIKQAQNQ